MFCPNCGAENLKDANYCRNCRANLSLIPQALTGQIPQPTDRRGKRHGRSPKPPTLQNGIREIVAGIGFMFVSLGVMLFGPGGRAWWFWLLIPAFTMLGKGISEIIAAKQQQPPVQYPPQAYAQPQHQQAIPPPPPAVDYQAPKTAELAQPPTSVTEGTTKLFE